MQLYCKASVCTIRCGGGGADLSVDIQIALCHQFASPLVVPSTHFSTRYVTDNYRTDAGEETSACQKHFTVSSLLQGHCLVGRAQE